MDQVALLMTMLIICIFEDTSKYFKDDNYVARYIKVTTTVQILNCQYSNIYSVSLKGASVKSTHGNPSRFGTVFNIESMYAKAKV